MATSNGFDVWLKVTLSNEGIKPGELAKRIGKTPSAVTNWTKGKGEPDWASLRAIADALGIPENKRRSLYVRAGRMTQEEAGVAPLPIPEMKAENAVEKMMEAIPYISRQTAWALVYKAHELEGAAWPAKTGSDDR
jgi:transcriptional regulator with XRE-family HTH domain